jgi:hypothetical protein
VAKKENKQHSQKLQAKFQNQVPLFFNSLFDIPCSLLDIQKMRRVAAFSEGKGWAINRVARSRSAWP